MWGEVCGAGRRERAWGSGSTSGAHAGRTRLEGSGGTERTKNMRVIFVTRDVSKISGWLNTAARCRVESRACDTGARCANRKARGLGGGAAAGASGPHAENPRLGGYCGGKARGGERT